MQDGESLVATGDNRYHAILGNSGPAKFVSASRFAPSTIAWDAKVRLVTQTRSVSEGVATTSVKEEWLPLEYFFQTPKVNSQGVTVLKPGQLITHLWLPAASDTRSATYEVLELCGLDQPQASAACCLGIDGGIIRKREDRARPCGPDSVDRPRSGQVAGRSATDRRHRRNCGPHGPRESDATQSQRLQSPDGGNGSEASVAQSHESTRRGFVIPAEVISPSF